MTTRKLCRALEEYEECWKIAATVRLAVSVGECEGSKEERTYVSYRTL